MSNTLIFYKNSIWLDKQIKVLYNKNSKKINGVLKMKLKFIFVSVLALLVSGCMDTIMAVPAAAVSGVGNVVGGIWGAVTSIF